MLLVVRIVIAPDSFKGSLAADRVAPTQRRCSPNSPRG
jgi:glycerate kinase